MKKTIQLTIKQINEKKYIQYWAYIHQLSDFWPDLFLSQHNSFNTTAHIPNLCTSTRWLLGYIF